MPLSHWRIITWYQKWYHMDFVLLSDRIVTSFQSECIQYILSPTVHSTHIGVLVYVNSKYVYWRDVLVYHFGVVFCADMAVCWRGRKTLLTHAVFLCRNRFSYSGCKQRLRMLQIDWRCIFCKLSVEVWFLCWQAVLYTQCLRIFCHVITASATGSRDVNPLISQSFVILLFG